MAHRDRLQRIDGVAQERILELSGRVARISHYRRDLGERLLDLRIDWIFPELLVIGSVNPQRGLTGAAQPKLSDRGIPANSHNAHHLRCNLVFGAEDVGALDRIRKWRTDQLFEPLPCPSD